VDDVGKVFDSEQGSVILPNPDLKPEYAYNFELGITHIFGDLAKLDATGYYTILKDAMVRRNYRLNGQDSILYDGELSQVLSIQNSAKAFVYGIQTGVEVKLPAGFSLTSNINYQAGEEELDDESTAPLRHAAPLFGSTHILWTRGKLKADLYSFYNGRIAFKNLAPEEQNKSYLYAIDGNGNPYSPAWYTLNFKFLYHATNFITLNLGLENITNQRYRPYSSGIAAPGTNFIISTRFTF
jgi:hemoglobin/transferrin/lactoferrin receptor protein